MSWGHIRKVFGEPGDAGSTSQYWDHSWAGEDLIGTVAQLQASPDAFLRSFVKVVPSSGTILEAGCGSGVVLTYLRDLGCHVVGLDFAIRTLRDTKNQRSELPLVGGNLGRLPFADRAFGCVISLGALEHFESGPTAALDEHRRVLKDDGLLLLTVPRLSLLKQWNDWRALALSRAKSYRSPRGRIVTRVREMTVTEDHDISFIQYEFPTRVVKGFLSAAGFETVSISAIYVRAGIGESAFVRRLSERRRGTVAGRHPSDAEAVVTSAGRELPSEMVRETERSRRSRWKPSTIEGTLRKAVLGESGEGVLGRLLTRLAQKVLGHMLFVIARPRLNANEGPGHRVP